ncbi:terminase [Lelliottia amnigena]|nr:terminase [Lelliottia amnigena]
MVLKAKDTIRRGCQVYDAGATDITQSFMAIRKNMTSSVRSSTYEASRSEEVSHADVAWTTMHALLNEPLFAGSGMHSTSILDIN